MRKKVTVESKNRISQYGKAVTVAISLPETLLNEVEKHRRFDTRSGYIVRAIDRFLREEENKGVEGSQVTSHKSHQPIFQMEVLEPEEG